MTNIDYEIINMIKEGYCIKDIEIKTKLSSKQIYVRLKRIRQNGYQLREYYFCDGTIKYELEPGFYSYNKEKRIIIPKNKTEFRCLFISDTHFGNMKDDFNLINKVYEYAAKNNISIIIHAGDFIE